MDQTYFLVAGHLRAEVELYEELPVEVDWLHVPVLSDVVVHDAAHRLGDGVSDKEIEITFTSDVDRTCRFWDSLANSQFDSSGSSQAAAAASQGREVL